MITEITGAIAVVVSVVYLGLQIRANTKVLRSQAHYTALSLAQRPMELMIENESLAKVVNVCYATPDALSEDDWVRCGNYVFMQFNAWEFCTTRIAMVRFRSSCGLAPMPTSRAWSKRNRD